MDRIRAIIVDDVQTNQRRLKELLTEHCPVIEVVNVAETVSASIAIIQETRPDLVFLDVELPDGTGFDILQAFNPVPFKVIFFTGHMEYAFQAIKFHAVDYLLKPIVIKELIEAVDLAGKQILNGAYQARIEGARRQFLNPDQTTIFDSNGFQVIPFNEIIKLEADANYTHMYLTGNRKLTYCRILKEFADLLKNHDPFIRTHKSFIVHLSHVKSYSHQGVIKLTDGLTASLGDTYREEFMQHFAQRTK
jgi:two-component system, LytTR family, response regulator